MSKNTRDGARIDDVAERLLRKDAVWEMQELMSEFPPDALTAFEILAVLAILRGAKERSGRRRQCWNSSDLSERRAIIGHRQMRGEPQPCKPL